MADTIHIPQDFAPLIPAFLARRHEDLAQIDLALASGDFGALQRLGHRMRGNGAAFGFDAISELGGQIEDAARSCLAGPIRQSAGALAAYLERIRIVYV